VLHSEAATGWGGQEIRVFQESLYLLEKGHRVSIVCRPGSPLAQRCSGVSHPGFSFYTVAMDSAVSPAALFALWRLLKLLNPDLLHTHSSIDSWLVSLCGWWLGIPIVRSRHVSIPVKNIPPKNWVYSKFPARIITSGEEVSRRMLAIDGVTPERVVSVSAGVDLRKFDSRISGAAVRRELGIDAGHPLVGKIGVVRGWKGYDHFLQAIPEVLKQIPDARFVAVGDGPGFNEIRNKARVAGLDPVLTFLGHREDVPEILAALDVLALASTAGEGTPQVIPQAFAMKTPVVATRVGSIPALLDEGRRGVLVESGNSEALARGIVEVLRDSGTADERAEKAHEFCIRELTFDRMMGKTIAVYGEVLAEAAQKKVK
jgi:glycosyltransferase involved in cell wall biosynthesis